ncbi:A disintegrin and metalloproteinase with thrombospondin motifs 12-like isoform X2 [Atheta coriaria]|uniref:A disintegrin and metalloproteinase with thrombospondin motifs 12-like isoform X2 n=1 Tax=Dalotia coriaria TaxID=877792 RepID=UPI0031F41754
MLKRRKKRQIDESPLVSYGVTFDGKKHQMDLWPNHAFLSPAAIVEKRAANVRQTTFQRIRRDLCHFVGKIRGIDESKVAISTCDGLAGYISINGKRYFIEPLSEHTPNKRGQHLHMIYTERLPSHFNGPRCGTNEDWTEAWKKRLREQEITEHDQEKRALDSVHRYLETLIVVDKKFLQHHKNSDFETYILTIMNMVSDYYHDASAGNQMDVVVVRIMYLEKEEDEIDLIINQDSDKTLESFCKWQQTVNPKDVKNPNHHDIAVLLTRYDLCADNMANCGLMGLAYVAAACTSDKPCAINEDAGLILGIVVAHEIGHVDCRMGCSHDTEEISGCKAQADDQSYYVMSPYVHLHTNVWSTCSKTFITTFFDNDLGECLNDEPEISLYKDNNMLPGTIYDAKYQCQMEFPGSSVCKVSPEKFCDRLLCRTEPGTCMSNGEPPVDGTKCGENKWCYNLKCVEIGERPQAVNGGWGDWGKFSECSRTCGGGVQISARECNNPRPQHRGRYCLGERKKTKICNTQLCPEGSTPFRAVQCASYNDKPFQEKLYHWKPYLKEDDTCSLYCINDDNTYVKLAPRVTDGTPCKAGTKNMCISGTCKVVGCDFIVDSDAVEDECGVCKGDGTECKITEHTFQGTTGQGYVKVAEIFRGSRNVLIEELKPSANTIAITGPDEKHYYLNGDFTEQPDGVREMGGVEGIYSHPAPNQEMLIIHGPLKENIVFFVTFYANENVGYRYKYAEPSAKSNYQPSYHWEFVDWGECSARCAGGVETSEAKCIEEKSGLVASSFCQATDKPPAKTRKCNEQPCRTKWRVGKWGKCMACKNVSGIRTREVECVSEAHKAGADDTLEEDSACSEKKPGTKELCNAPNPCQKRQNSKIDQDLTPEMMRQVWLQSWDAPIVDPKLPDFLSNIKNPNKLRREMKKYPKIDKNTCIDPNFDKNTKDGNKKQEAKDKLKVGTIAKDPRDPEQANLIQIPLRQSHNDINLTDEAFEEMGDKLPDTLDEQHAKILKGEEAVNFLTNLEHCNVTHEEST